MSGLDHAIKGLRQAVNGPRRHPMWRWLVRNRMASVKEELRAERLRGHEAWLAPRELSLHRERLALLQELTEAGPLVLEHGDTEVVQAELERLLTRLDRYRQRLNDLVYDSVSLELGGSE